MAQLDDNGIERPVAYASATLSDAQQNYGITDKEGLTVVWAVKKWFGHFIHGSSALVVIDSVIYLPAARWKMLNILLPAAG